MKRFTAILMCVLMLASALASCASAPTATVSSASDYADEAWLKTRLGDVPANVTVGTAESLGIDMTSFEDDGYFIRTESGETVIAGKTADGLDRAVRKYAKTVRDGAPVCDTSYHEGYRIDRLTVAGRDISEYTVVYTHTVAPSYPYMGYTRGNGEFSAKEFVRLTKAATGIELALSDTPVSAPYVLFECVEDGGEFGNSGYSYEVKDGNLIFRGSGVCGGVTNGVYHFFEDECGWLDLTAGFEILAESEHTDIPEGTKKSGRALLNTFYDTGLSDVPLRFAHSHYCGLCSVACHGIQNQNLITTENFNWFWDMPCYTDPEVIDNCVENVKAIVQSKLDAGDVIGDTLLSIDIAQPDNRNWCKCKNCKAVLKEESGFHSGMMMRFSNAVSEAVDEEYPGLRYLVFAYEDTKHPPIKTKPNDLLNVTFCLDGSCFVHSLTSGDCFGSTSKNSGGITNAVYADWIRTWCDLCPNTYCWYYAMDGGVNQYNTLDVIYEDFKFFGEANVCGVFLEAENYGMGIGRFHNIMSYYMQNHPDCTYDEYLAALYERYEAYYGEDTVDTVREYAQIFKSSNLHVDDTCWFNEQMKPFYTNYDYIGEVADAADAHLEACIENAECAEQAIRMKKLSLFMLYEGFAKRYYRAHNAGDAEQMEYLSAIYDKFISRMDEVGFNRWAFPCGIAFPRCFAPTAEEEYENLARDFDPQG